MVIKKTFKDKKLSRQEATSIHGVLSGLICSGSISNGKTALEQVLLYIQNTSHFKHLERSLILELYLKTCEQFHEDMFSPIIPNKKASLQTRAIALSEWCQGFVIGFAYSADDVILQSEVLETALYHIAEIGNLDYSKINVSHEDEQTFSTALSCIQSAACLLHDCLTLSREKDERPLLH